MLLIIRPRVFFTHAAEWW